MKVYILGNRTNKISQASFKDIVIELEKEGHKVDKTWINRKAEEDAEEFEETYSRSMKSIKNCDVLIAEISSMSSGIGFLISSALNQKKPVLAMFNEASDDNQSTTLKGSKNKLMHYVVYNNKSISTTVSNFINNAKSILDTKFILIISPEIDRYLEWASSTKRMHKAQIVREAVEEMMKKDKDWKKISS